MGALDQEIAAFEARIDELNQHHLGKWVVFHGGAFVDAFDTFDNAAKEAVLRFGAGPYLIRQVGAPTPQLSASAMFWPTHAAR